MKLLLDFLPVILFFVTFKYADANKEWAADFATRHLGWMVSGGQVNGEIAPVLLATVVVVIATCAQVALLKIRGRRVDFMLWVSLVLVVVLGALTVWFHSETFIKWKPSVLYWAMAAAFWISQTFFGRNLLKLLMGASLNLEEAVWRRLGLAWTLFFVVMGLINLWVAYTFSTDTWVNFKLFGVLGLILVFTVGQGLYLGRHIKDEPGEASK